MTKEEMARAYADGYNKEYQQIAYDAFLCGYGAKCESVVSEELEEAAEEHSGLNFDRQMEYKSFWNDVDTFIAGAEWQKKRDDLETADLLAIAHLQGMEQQKAKMLEEAAKI